MWCVGGGGRRSSASYAALGPPSVQGRIGGGLPAPLRPSCRPQQLMESGALVVPVMPGCACHAFETDPASPRPLSLPPHVCCPPSLCCPPSPCRTSDLSSTTSAWRRSRTRRAASRFFWRLHMGEGQCSAARHRHSDVWRDARQQSGYATGCTARGHRRENTNAHRVHDCMRAPRAGASKIPSRAIRLSALPRYHPPMRPSGHP